ncbi:hypothetical protein KQX54_004582 [Cotesia glomerata]|uniref:Uncharacterized protein n=1 Tax=Cotesia glomerata TaxID=32391 RepID=A0AAV7I851_COTGL|nr:hypothetical protein KQX54_004582 [Cotesia glomerata]
MGFSSGPESVVGVRQIYHYLGLTVAMQLEPVNRAVDVYTPIPIRLDPPAAQHPASNILSPFLFLSSSCLDVLVRLMMGHISSTSHVAAFLVLISSRDSLFCRELYYINQAENELREDRLATDEDTAITCT